MATKQPSLKPCPFCGGKARIQSGDDTEGFYVDCAGWLKGECYLNGFGWDEVRHKFPTREKARQAWNRRVGAYRGDH